MFNNILNNNTNIIMIIMALIIIILLIYITKLLRKENKEGFANASSTFGGMTFTWDEATKTLNMDGGKVNISSDITAKSVSTTTPNGKTTMGAKDGFPGIFTDQNQMKVHNFTFGNQIAGGDNSGMRDDKKYNYIKSDGVSYALVNKANSGHLGTAWSDNRLYINYLDKNNRVGPNTTDVSTD